MNNLTQQLRDLADCKHSDLSVASDAADEIDRLETALRIAAGYISGTTPFRAWHPESVLEWIKNVEKEYSQR